MKIARFQVDGEISFGILDRAENGEGGSAGAEATDTESADTELVELSGDPMIAGFDTTGRRFRLADVRLLAPVIPRSKVVCVGKNYADHIAEMREVTGADAPVDPLLFLKPNTAVIGPGDTIVRPAISERVEYEGEVAMVIGAVAKDVPEEGALRYVFGFTAANDVTARDLQIADGQWARAKGFDTFCPLGPVIETDPEFLRSDASLVTRVNGEVRQDARLSQLIFSFERIVAHASQAFTLLPGDVILTGTPAGVGALNAGDTVEVEIEGIGILRNPVS